jgi:D-tyrosyl-tRNA(Tyr) deacylase
VKAVIQRTLTPATVKVDDTVTGRIDKGLIVYLGIGKEDTEEDIAWLAKKIVQMRIFSDEAGKMNLNVEQIGGGLLVISQFTLYASTKKGNRPSYLNSASPDLAKDLYNRFIEHTTTHYRLPVESGIFAADMKVEYINDGPVTILMDTKNKE